MKARVRIGAAVFTDYPLFHRIGSDWVITSKASHTEASGTGALWIERASLRRAELSIAPPAIHHTFERQPGLVPLDLAERHCHGNDARHHFPPEVIRHAVWLYLRFTLSDRDVEELLAERRIQLS